MGSEALKPRCALRVGVVGNRRFAGELDSPTAPADAMRVQARAAFDAVLEAFLESIEKVLDHPYPHRDGSAILMRSLFSRDERPRLAVISSLAAGIDQIGAEAALSKTLHQVAENKNIQVQLEAVLPFLSDAEYPGLPGLPSNDFRENEKEALRRLAKDACQVIRLGGDHRDEPSRQRAYQQARDLLLENSDVLIAAYDPSAKGGRGGTVETIRQALKLNTPVIAVLLREGDTGIVFVHTRPCEDEDAAPEGAAALAIGDPLSWKIQLEECVRNQLVLPELLLQPAGGGADYDGDHDVVGNALHRLRLLSGEEKLHLLCAVRTFEIIFGAAWNGLQYMVQAIVRERLPPRTAEEQITLPPYGPFYRRASDQLSIPYMRTYRGGFVLAYGLASLAVVAAVAMMAASLLVEGHGHPHWSVVTALCLAKLIVIGMLFALEWGDHGGRLQETAADFRYLAELLRPMQWLAPVGTYPPAVELPLHASRNDPRRSWMAWVARATARTYPCVAVRDSNGNWQHPSQVSVTPETATMSLEAARKQWIEEQVGYHDRNARQMRMIEKGLERASKWLVWSVLGAAVIACFMELTEICNQVAVILGAAAAILPAMIASLTGTAFQSEAKRLAMRSEAMKHVLQEKQGDLDRVVENIRNGPCRDIARAAASRMLAGISRITITEAGDWKILYEIHAIRA
jgi:hypothetical protein